MHGRLWLPFGLYRPNQPRWRRLLAVPDRPVPCIVARPIRTACCRHGRMPRWQHRCKPDGGFESAGNPRLQLRPTARRALDRVVYRARGAFCALAAGGGTAQECKLAHNGPQRRRCKTCQPRQKDRPGARPAVWTLVFVGRSPLECRLPTHRAGIMWRNAQASEGIRAMMQGRTSPRAASRTASNKYKSACLPDAAP